MSLNPIKNTICIAAIVSALASPALAGPTEDFRAAKTVKQAKAAGGQQISGASIQKILSGRKFDNPDWTWSIKSNGTHSSKAKDGSWSDNGKWEVRGNQYCRSSQATEGKTICSNVYFLGRDLRFSEAANPKKLLNWFVSY